MMDYEFLKRASFFSSLLCQFVFYVFVGAGLVYNLLQLHTAELLQWCNFVFSDRPAGSGCIQPKCGRSESENCTASNQSTNYRLWTGAFQVSIQSGHAATVVMWAVRFKNFKVL